MRGMIPPPSSFGAEDGGVRDPTPLPSSLRACSEPYRPPIIFVGLKMGGVIYPPPILLRLLRLLVPWQLASRCSSCHAQR